MDHNKPYDRIERVNKQIHDILGGILNKNIDLNYLGFVTFTKIDVSRDLRTAKVFYSVINPAMSMEKINIEINKHRKPFKKYMSPELRMKHILYTQKYHHNKISNQVCASLIAPDSYTS